MADISIEQRIIEKLHQLDDTAKQRVLDFIEQADTREDEWEERVLSESLGDAIQPDGRINFDRLHDSGKTMTLEELYPEGDEDDGA